MAKNKQSINLNHLNPIGYPRIIGVLERNVVEIDKMKNDIQDVLNFAKKTIGVIPQFSNLYEKYHIPIN